jgi:hypothetical protein
MANIDEEFRVFRRLVNEQMSFLVNEFGFQEVRTGKHDPGMWIVFTSATTGITVNFEFGSGLWVSLGRLDADGVTFVDGCALGHLLAVRAPDLVRPATPKDFEPEKIERALQVQASLLKQYASDVLAGNFGIFPEVARIRDADMARQLVEDMGG